MDVDNKPLSATYYKSRGQFNLLSNEKQWQVVLRATNGTAISQLWDADDEPSIAGRPPSEVAEIISERLESFLFISDREKSREKIQWFRDNAAVIDSNWARDQIADLERRIASLRKCICDEETDE